eukprot:TRINITY_DN862_c0_g1_i1.p1 TRINITY_DN862_c0_g1~~TRINITY_DN862_c0_g1_i1.p1  ORF type:complete len:203 (+),score=39.81 TRINITY_DN862_c0_g1_i1:26-610(+)
MDGLNESEIDVELYVFKNTRVASTLKHTGLVFSKARKDGAGEEEASWYIHEVTGGRDAGAFSSKSAVVTRMIDLHGFLAMEDVVHASSLSVGESLFDDLLERSFAYNLVSNNCRDHAYGVLDLLQSMGFVVKQTALDYLRTVKRNDVLVATGLVAAVGVMTAAYFTNKIPALLALAALPALPQRMGEEEGEDEE